MKEIVGIAGSRWRFTGRILRKCSLLMTEVAYKDLVRSILEYCSSVWDPYQVVLVDEVEKIQRRAVCFVIGSFRKRERLRDMFNQLQWETLQERGFASWCGLL